MIKVKEYSGFNERRYGNPWIAKINNGKFDFTEKVGGYTGAYNAGEEGYLYIDAPQEGQVYGYGQKDYRGSNTSVSYVVYQGNELKKCNKLGDVQ